MGGRSGSVGVDFGDTVMAAHTGWSLGEGEGGAFQATPVACTWEGEETPVPAGVGRSAEGSLLDAAEGRLAANWADCVLTTVGRAIAEGGTTESAVLSNGVSAVEALRWRLRGLRRCLAKPCPDLLAVVLAVPSTVPPSAYPVIRDIAQEAGGAALPVALVVSELEAAACDWIGRTPPEEGAAGLVLTLHVGAHSSAYGLFQFCLAAGGLVLRTLSCGPAGVEGVSLDRSLGECVELAKGCPPAEQGTARQRLGEQLKRGGVHVVDWVSSGRERADQCLRRHAERCARVLHECWERHSHAATGPPRAIVVTGGNARLEGLREAIRMLRFRFGGATVQHQRVEAVGEGAAWLSHQMARRGGEWVQMQRGPLLVLGEPLGGRWFPVISVDDRGGIWRTPLQLAGETSRLAVAWVSGPADGDVSIYDYITVPADGSHRDVIVEARRTAGPDEEPLRTAVTVRDAEGGAELARTTGPLWRQGAGQNAVSSEAPRRGRGRWHAIVPANRGVGEWRHAWVPGSSS